MRLLYFSPASFGGLADYAHEQAQALVDLGAQVTMLVTDRFPTGRRERYAVAPLLAEPSPGAGPWPRAFRKLRQAQGVVRQRRALADVVLRERFDSVLLGAFAEYLAPLWAGRLRRLTGEGVVFGAMVHDPVRDFVLGPLWWHRWSVARAYSFLREAFVHETIQLDTIRPAPQLRTTVIPHGVYRFPAPTQSREEARRSLGLPAGAKVLLSFGHVRDGKNLDLVLRAMVQVPEAHLVVAGQAQSSGQKDAAFYQNLADELGVAGRCRWLVRFVAREEVGNLFAAADVVLVVNSRHFRSASGVLNVAVPFRRVCLVSGGEGNLRSVVQNYDLGVWVEPDSVDALARGMNQCFAHPPAPRWDAYEAENSWQRNAELVLRQMRTAGE